MPNSSINKVRLAHEAATGVIESQPQSPLVFIFAPNLDSGRALAHEGWSCLPSQEWRGWRLSPGFLRGSHQQINDVIRVIGHGGNAGAEVMQRYQAFIHSRPFRQVSYELGALLLCPMFPT